MEELKVFDLLPECIMFEIFLRLPVKSLARLRYVCKSWRNLIISNEVFIGAHLKLATANKDCHVEILMFNPRYSGENDDDKATKLRDLPLKTDENNPVLNLGEGLIVSGCVDGIICLFKLRTRMVYLWNPALHECRPLQTMNARCNFCGFCYDPKNQDHIIVVMSSSLDGVEIELYSLKNNRWKFVPCSLPAPLNMIHNLRYPSPLYLNGCFHWIAGPNSHGTDYCLFILAFDIDCEKLNLLELPSSVSNLDSFSGYLGVLNECVSFVVESSMDLDVWLMKTYGVAESWTKFVKITWAIQGIGYYELVGAYMNGKILLRELKTVVAYDFLQRKAYANFSVRCDEESIFDKYVLVDYVPSLISVMPPSSVE